MASEFFGPGQLLALKILGFERSYSQRVCFLPGPQARDARSIGMIATQRATASMLYVISAPRIVRLHVHLESAP